MHMFVQMTIHILMGFRHAHVCTNDYSYLVLVMHMFVRMTIHILMGFCHAHLCTNDYPFLVFVITDSKNRLERENCRVYVRHTKNFFDALRTSHPYCTQFFRILFDTLALLQNSTLISIKSRRPHLLSHHQKLSVATTSQRSSIVIFGVWGLKGSPQTPISKKLNGVFWAFRPLHARYTVLN